MHYILDALKVNVKLVSPHTHGSLKTKRYINSLITRQLPGKGRELQLSVSGYHADTPITIKAEPFMRPTAAFINIHEHPL